MVPPPQVLMQLEAVVPPSEPLEMLVARLRKPSPPALDMLIQIFIPVADAADFSSIVKLYLPDMWQKIMAIQFPVEQMTTFAENFSERYFPIVEDEGFYDDGPDEDGNVYRRLVDQVPLTRTMGMSSDDYDRITQDGTNTEIILAYILENPFVETDRPAFAEAAGNLLPIRVIEAIPEEGFEMEKLEEWLKETAFEPVAFWADIVRHNTGNEFFDIFGSLEEDGAEYRIMWNKGTIDAMTGKWQEAEDWNGKWREFQEFFEKDMVDNARKLIKILKEKSGTNDKEKDEDDGWPDPESNPNQGRLIDVLPDNAPVAGATNPGDTTGQANSPFGLL
jgi:hypothetical protein